jgi:hypothetical protein
MASIEEYRQLFTTNEERIMSNERKVKGEGNYEAAEKFDKEEQAFVKSGRVEKAANDAAPKTPQEAEEMRRAEQVGRSHCKGDDTKIPSKTDKTGQGK